jgi:hypothetical protein
MELNASASQLPERIGSTYSWGRASHLIRAAHSSAAWRAWRKHRARSLRSDWHIEAMSNSDSRRFPVTVNPSTRSALPDLPPYGRLPAGQPQRGPDRALPPGSSRSARPAFSVTVRGAPG